MAIPKMTSDLEIIQKLSDLPNATDGLTAEQLKEKFDEAGILIKQYLNDTLVPALAAKNIPFNRLEEIDANNVQSAIAEVQRQIAEAVSGTIPNGAVTKEKLAAELLARVFGGVPWVSIKTPDSTDNTEAEFPIGQIWLRPAFTVKNERTMNWITSGCSVAAEAQKVTMTGNNTATDTKMTQSLTNIGNEGDVVYILFDTTERDAEIIGLTMSVNSGEEIVVGSTMCVSDKLQASGSLTMTVTAQWPSVSLSDGKVVLENYTVVNVSKILRSLPDAKDMADWPGYLRNSLPLETYDSPEEVYIQYKDGKWLTAMYDVLPQERGGTGRSELLTPGLLLYGSPEGGFSQVAAPETAGSLLSFEGGTPKWVTREEVVADGGAMQSKSGTYEGTDTDMDLDLGCEAKILYIREVSDPDLTGNEDFKPETEFMMAGEYWVLRRDYKPSPTGASYWFRNHIRLTGNLLQNWCVKDDEGAVPYYYLNSTGKRYSWLALY